MSQGSLWRPLIIALSGIQASTNHCVDWFGHLLLHKGSLTWCLTFLHPGCSRQGSPEQIVLCIINMTSVLLQIPLDRHYNACVWSVGGNLRRRGERANSMMKKSTTTKSVGEWAQGLLTVRLPSEPWWMLRCEFEGFKNISRLQSHISIKYTL